jgi:hypothetical protein
VLEYHSKKVTAKAANLHKMDKKFKVENVDLTMATSELFTEQSHIAVEEEREEDLMKLHLMQNNYMKYKFTYGVYKVKKIWGTLSLIFGLSWIGLTIAIVNLSIYV